MNPQSVPSNHDKTSELVTAPAVKEIATKELRVLIVEDSEDDAFLILRELQRGGYRLIYQQVDTSGTMAAALKSQTWDLVIADYNLPQFNAIEALNILKQNNLDIPFIIVSGSIGEETAVAAMKAGAHDYLMKSNLARLVPAVARELREAEERSKRRLAEQALRHSDERFRSLIENALDIIVVMDRLGKIVYTSPSVERLLGYNPEALVGKKAYSMIHPRDTNRVYEAFRKAIRKDDHSVTIEFRFRHHNGSWRMVEAIGKRFIDANNTPSLVVNARDISDRKQAEEIRKALQKEKELNELKSRFVSIVSHEFRTPLSIIVLSATLLERFYKDASEEKRQTYISRITLATRRMTQLLDDVLFLGKADVGKQEFKPSDLELVHFCQELIEEMKLADHHCHDIEFICSESSLIGCMDESLLRHILSNLLSNAIKYSPNHKTVSLKLHQQGDRIIFQVRDWGIGIPAIDLGQLFVSFHRGSNVDKIPGTGLGLAIVHQSVQLHQGRIAVESQVGQGTTFTVDLPLISNT